MKLTTGQRKALPKSDFAVPSKKAYPVPDKGHAKAALARASEFGTPKVKAEVRAKVAAKFPGMEQKSNAGTKAPKEPTHPQSHAEFIKLGS